MIRRNAYTREWHMADPGLWIITVAILWAGIIYAAWRASR